MRFDLHLRGTVKQRLAEVAGSMVAWEGGYKLTKNELASLAARLVAYDHTVSTETATVCAVDGSGDFPLLSHADSFVYLATAQAVRYETSPECGLKEVGPALPGVIEFCWLPEAEDRRHQELDRCFAGLAGASLAEVVAESDYLALKSAATGRAQHTSQAVEMLIRPHASDSGNLGIQLRSCAELGATARLLRQKMGGNLILMDGTLSLPFVSRDGASLFHEHLKRWCCTEARAQGVHLLFLSKSHGLPGIELLEQIAAEVVGTSGVAEHWFLRLPLDSETWKLSLAEGRNIPPVGAVSYLWRSHAATPVFRVDVDHAWWLSAIRGQSEAKTRENETRLFELLDYIGHDQRAFGYPYPLKAAHDRSSLTQAERLALKKQLIDYAIAQGMSRRTFIDASVLTGHA